MDALNTVVHQQKTYAQSNSKFATSGDLASTASRRTDKSKSRHQDRHRPLTDEGAPQTIYQPKSAWGHATRPDVPHGSPPYQTSGRDQLGCVSKLRTDTSRPSPRMIRQPA